MARLGPTHGTNTGSRAPIFGYKVLYDVYKGGAAREINWGLYWGRNYDRHGRCALDLQKTARGARPYS